MRRETQRLREQVHAMHEQRRSQHGSTRPKRRATATGMSSTSKQQKSLLLIPISIAFLNYQIII
jgi:hypothetical protein